MIKRFLLIVFFISLFSQSIYAADDGDWWLQRNVSIGDGQNEYRRINVTSRHAYDAPITKDGITKMERLFKNVVVEDVPSKSKLGNVLLKRAKAFKGGIAGVLGGAAITAAIEAVGWVMEEGTYVKYRKPDDCTSASSTKDTCNSQYLYDAAYNVTYATNKPSPESACSFLMNDSTAKSTFTSSTPRVRGSNNGMVLYECLMPNKSGGNYTTPVYTKLNPDFKQEPQPQRIVITPEDVGGIVSGDYKDPVDSKYDISDKKYHPVVTTAYDHDQNGIGDDIADEMDDRIKNAPPTNDGKPAPVGDPRYKNAPQPDQKSNDRSWDYKADSTGEGQTKPVVDPETGEPTGEQSISFEFPVFCEWAFKVCDWYDDWKKTDAWMKEEPELKDETLDIDQENPLSYERQNYVQFGQTCPFSPKQYALPLGNIGSIDFEADASILCEYGSIARPFIIGLGHLGCLIYLLYALRSGSA